MLDNHGLQNLCGKMRSASLLGWELMGSLKTVLFYMHGAIARRSASSSVTTAKCFDLVVCAGDAGTTQPRLRLAGVGRHVRRH